jgi:transcriptional regulator with XRE-family HTH domain
MAGRRRSPLTGSGLPVELAQRLRGLRDARELTLRQLAGRSGYSASSLSQAESGREVPSWEVVSAFVQACGEDPARWRHLWELTRTPPAAGGQPTPQEQAPPERTPPEQALTEQALPERGFSEAGPGGRGRRRWRRPAVAAVAVTGLALSAAIAWQAVGAPLAGAPRARPSGGATPAGRLPAAARDNTDPYSDGCRTDERLLDWKPVYRASGQMFGLILLMYSPACQAAWAYLVAPNSSRWTIHIITRRTPGHGIDQWQFSGDVDLGSWGNVLSTQDGCVYTEAYVTDKSGQGPIARTACIQPTSQHPVQGL